MAEQLPLLERPEHDMGAALLLPDDLPELRAWIEERIPGIDRGEDWWNRRQDRSGATLRTYHIWPHAWVLRDLTAALPDASAFAELVEARHRSAPVDAREVRALIAAVEAELAGGVG